MLPIIILVWGVVFYQLFSYFFSAPTYVIEKSEITIDIDKIEKDTFSIVADYRDPFLGKKISELRPVTTNGIKRNNTKKRTKITEPINQPWPVIQYKGMIKNNNSEKRVGIVNIAGQERLVKEGDILNGVKFLSIGKTHIKVVFQKEQKTILI